jgi:hypothetical protein
MTDPAYPGRMLFVNLHGWQEMWMDPAAAEQSFEAFAASTPDADAAA